MLKWLRYKNHILKNKYLLNKSINNNQFILYLPENKLQINLTDMLISVKVVKPTHLLPKKSLIEYQKNNRAPH